jgi:hypothetical protein
MSFIAQQSTKIKAQRDAKKLFTFSQVVDIVEPYSLYPKEELVRLLKIFMFVVVVQAKKGYTVRLPYLGDFLGYHRDSFTYYQPTKGCKETVGPRILFKHYATPFIKWFCAPELVTMLTPDKAVSFFKLLRKTVVELFKTEPEFIKDVLPDPKLEEEALARCRKFNCFREWKTQRPFTSFK